MFTDLHVVYAPFAKAHKNPEEDFTLIKRLNVELNVNKSYNLCFGMEYTINKKIHNTQNNQYSFGLISILFLFFLIRHSNMCLPFNGTLTLRITAISSAHTLEFDERKTKENPKLHVETLTPSAIVLRTSQSDNSASFDKQWTSANELLHTSINFSLLTDSFRMIYYYSRRLFNSSNWAHSSSSSSSRNYYQYYRVTCFCDFAIKSHKQTKLLLFWWCCAKNPKFAQFVYLTFSMSRVNMYIAIWTSWEIVNETFELVIVNSKIRTLLRRIKSVK